MRYVKLKKDKVFEFLEYLKDFGILHAPIKISEKSYDFKEIDDVKQIEFDYNRTIMPLRKFFFPPKETMFYFNKDKQELYDACDDDSSEIACAEKETFVLFGVHSCDIVGVRIMDSRFLDENPDPYYHKRRKRSIIVGLSCIPDEYCFCNVRGTDYVDTGFDLFLHDIDDGYLIRVGSVTGHEIIDNKNSLFTEVMDDDITKMTIKEKIFNDSFKIDTNLDSLRYYMESRRDISPMWMRESEKCLGCGNCTLTCPTCRCYDVKDLPNLDRNTGERIRFWDSCQFISHGLVAGDHNFRGEKIDRFKNRYMCKNAYCEDLTTAYCVGCGRCSAYCPAGIDFLSNQLELMGINLKEELKH